MKKAMKKKRRLNLKNIFISVITIIFVAVIGSIFTKENTNSIWYEQIKSSLTPPNYVFPVVWSLLFILIAIAFYFSLENTKGKNRREVITLYIINFILNVLWSFLFFNMKTIWIAFLDLILIWTSILLLIIANWAYSRKSSYLLLPYLLWVSFAGILNYLSWMRSITL